MQTYVSNNYCLNVVYIFLFNELNSKLLVSNKFFYLLNLLIVQRSDQIAHNVK